MKIALPINDAQEFCAHYGAATALACYTADNATRKIRVHGSLLPIAKSPCAWPEWLRDEGVDVMLVGGMGAGARARCDALGIQVIAGLPSGTPEALATAYLEGTLQPGENACGHGHHDGHGHHAGHDHPHDHSHEGHCQCGH
jgi:predicted Fe-Mo cluster-binding NifX family protein